MTRGAADFSRSVAPLVVLSGGPADKGMRPPLIIGV